MHYFEYIFFLIILSFLALFVLVSLYTLDITKTKSQQKMLFIKLSLVTMIVCLFGFLLSRFYVPETVQILTSGTFANQNNTAISAINSFKYQTSSSLAYIMLTYALGCSIMVLRIIFSYWRANKKLRASQPEILQDQLVFISDCISSPLCFGFFKPKIYFPKGAKSRWTSREIEIALAHEKIHIEQYDSCWKLVSLLLQAVLFFAPWIYFLHRRVSLEIEIYCDAKARERTRADIYEYGNVLLTMACNYQQNLIFNNIKDSTLKRRLVAMKYKVKNTVMLIAMLSAILLAAGTTAIGMSSNIAAKTNFFKISSKIFIDGKLVSHPIILTKENQYASISFGSDNKNGRELLRMKLVARNVSTLTKNNAIEIDYQIEYTNGESEMRLNPQMIVVPNQENQIKLSSDPRHTFEMHVFAERE